MVTRQYFAIVALMAGGCQDKARDITGFTILPPPNLASGRKTLGEMMAELERKGQAGVNVEVEVSVHVNENTI